MALTAFSSRIIADVGICFGDEGKGRLIYELIREIEAAANDPVPVAAVVKVNGGANSGHTAGGLKLNLLPAGVLAPNVPHLGIGSGVVADPRKFWWESMPLEKQGYKVLSRLAIDERAQVSDLTHRLLDLAWEDYRMRVIREAPRGSTGRGISPAYCDEAGQWQLFYHAFKGGKGAFALQLRQRAARAQDTIQHVCKVSEADWAGFFDTLTAAEQRANATSVQTGCFPESEFDFRPFKGSHSFRLDVDALIDVYWNAGAALAERICDLRELTRKALAEGRYIIGEFGQSFWLDKRHGFPPNVTASHAYTAEIFQSLALPVQPVHSIGVSKAYDTKVGTHHFLTEMPEEHPLAKRLKQLEFGTATGRQRMVGWFDAVEKGETLRYGGFQDMAINKLDALGPAGAWQGGELLICTAYRRPDNTIIREVPRDEALRRQLRPVYRQLPGWEESIGGVRHFRDLPENARRYVAAMVKSVLEVAFRGEALPDALPNLRYIGVGPEPGEIIRDVPETAELLKLASW